MIIFLAGLCAQTLSKSDAIAFSDVARSHYYSLRNHGFESFTCDIKPDWDTLPNVMLGPVELTGKKPVETTRLQVTMTSRGNITFQHQYPADASALMTPVYDKFFGWLSSLVQGFLTTWGSKAVSGIIPDKFLVSSVEIMPHGHLITSNASGQHIELMLDNDYRVSNLSQTAANQKIVEQPVFNDSPEGWLLIGDSGMFTGSNSATHINYDLSYRPVDTLQLPQNIHLMVNDNIDIKFSFENCTAVHGIVVHVSPPPSAHKPD
jgi:hypothetical protein